MGTDERELRTAWQRHIGATAAAHGWFDAIVARHRDGDRHYHDLRHVCWVVRHVRELATDTVPPRSDDQLDRLVAAACFHDAVYDAERGDNEERSARLAHRALGEIGWPDEALDEVTAMIRATAGHAHDDIDTTTAVLLAADLAVLAAEPNRYGDYVRNVRREYAHLDDDAWRAGRIAFVDTMLGRGRIFPVELGLDDWERRARANLTAERAAMSTVSGARDAGDGPEP